MKKLLLILPLSLYFVASLQAECQSCNAPRSRARANKYKNRDGYPAQTSRRNRQVVQPMIETRPARMQQEQGNMEMIDVQEVIAQPMPAASKPMAAPAKKVMPAPAMEMMEIEQVVSEPAKPTLGMLPTPQAKVTLPAPQKMVVAMANNDVVRAKVHEGVNQTNYTASVGKTGSLVHVTETKPVEATLSGKMITPQVVEGQLQQKERRLSDDEARMYHQKIKAAAAA